MWGEATRTSQGKKDSVTPPVSPQDRDDISIFADKSRKFDEADNSFRELVDALSAYKAAILHASDCGVTVATQMEKFFANRDRDPANLHTTFKDAQLSIRSKWTSDAEKSFDADVIAPIQSRVAEIPKVRDLIKQRAAALTEMQKRQKKLQSERKREGSRLRDKQRRLKEISDRYAFFHDQVIQRFNYIDRNMGTFVAAPLRSLVLIMIEVSKASVESLDQAVKLVQETPPITKDLNSVPPMVTLTDVAGGIVDQETWDDSYRFDDNDDERDDEQDDDDEENDIDDADTDSASARASGRRPPAGRGRVRSADAAGKGPGSSISGLLSGMDSLSADAAAIASPRRGWSASAPLETLSVHSQPVPHPFGAHNSMSMQRELPNGQGFISGRNSQVGTDPYFLPSVGTSAASSTSTEITGTDGMRVSSTQIESFHRRRRRDGKGSGDTVGSDEKLYGNDVLTRLVAIYDFTPQESNELEIHIGDVIEVSAKSDSGWWTGACGPSSGYFPRNYTRELTEQEELEFLAEKKRRKRRGHRRQESLDSRRSGQTAAHSSVAL